MKVSEYLKDFHDPRGDTGALVDPQVSDRIAGEIRRIISMDLDELDIATAVQIYNASLDQEEFVAAWGLLHSAERACWKNFVNYDEYLRNEMRKRDAN